MKEKILNHKFVVLHRGFSLRDFVEHPLFSGSAIMIVGSNSTNLIAYLYHVIIGRMLGPAAYGVLVATLSLIGLVTVSFQFLGLVIVKFVSAEKDQKTSLFPWFYKNSIRVGLIFSVFAILATPFLSSFLAIKVSILLLLSPMFFFAAILLFYRSYLQGLLKFKEYVVSTNLELVARLVIGVLLILLGFSVFGAVAGIVLASLLALIFLRILFRRYPTTGQASDLVGTKEILTYTLPVFVATLANFSLVTTDVILVKHFFPAHDAGIYGALSNLGKIIFYGTAPVSAVMFPIVARKHAKGESYAKIVVLSLVMTFVIATCVTVIYHYFPTLMVMILYGKDFLEAVPYLSTFAIFMTIYTMVALLISFYLSREKTGIAYFSVGAALLQIVGISVYHNSIYSVMHISIAVTCLLLIFLLAYFIYETKKAKI